MPIAARRASTTYRFARFVARHRVGVGLATVALLALIGALATALVQARLAREQTAQAQAAARLAMQQSERAEGVRRILVGVFEQAEPDAHGGQPISARELLERGERQIAGAFELQPAVESDAATLIAELYVQIGDFGRAKALLQRALEASDDPRVPDDVKARVLIGISVVEAETNAYEDALAHARAGLALLAKMGAGSAASIAKAHSVIAAVLIEIGRLDEAEALLRASLARDTVSLGAHSEAVGQTWIHLGNVLARTDRFDEAEQAFRTGIATMQALFGEDSYHVAHALNELSSLLSDRNDFEGAERALRQSLQIRLRTVGDEHRDTYIVRHNLLVLQETMGRIAEALPERLALLERARASGRINLRDLASYYLATGRDQRDVGEFDAAAPNLRKAIQGFSDTLGPTTDVVVSAWRSLGTTLTLAGRYAEAEEALRKAMQIQLGRPDDSAVRMASVQLDLGNLLRLRHRLDDAAAMLEPAAATFDDGAFASSSLRPAALAALAELQLDRGDATAARESARRAVEAARENLLPRHFLVAAPLFALARAELALGDAEAAGPLLQEALGLREAIHLPDDPRLLEVRAAHVAVLAATGREREAIAARESLAPRLRASRSPYAKDLLARLEAVHARP